MNKPPRFATREDADLFMQCYKDKKAFPPELWIHPFRVLPNGDVVPNAEYTNAPFEFRLVGRHSYLDTINL